MFDSEALKKVETLAEKISGQSLGFAESCTGGLISAHVTAVSGVSSFFKGAVVSYAGEVKSKVLSVPEEELKKFGEVSEEVAKSMALGTQKTLNVDWALSVTGIAGPSGGTVEKPVGTVCFSVCGPQGEVKTERKLFDGLDREGVQTKTLNHALDLLLECIQK